MLGPAACKRLHFHVPVAPASFTAARYGIRTGLNWAAALSSLAYLTQMVSHPSSHLGKRRQA
jgi:hypothetical protein